jgi:uncharacterized protein (TIGR03437 family)
MLSRHIPKLAASMLLLLATTPLCFGQFFGLATTNDGSRLYFSSTLRLRGSDEYLTSKIFMMDSAGAHLIDDEGEPPGVVWNDLYSPSVTGAGSLLVYNAEYSCLGFGTICILGELSSPTTPPGTPNPFFGAGGVVISRNGRFGVLYQTRGGHGGETTLIDLSTGATTILTEYGIGRPLVATNGLVLMTLVERGPALINQSQTIQLEPGITAFGMSDDGAVIVYAKTVSDSESRLVLIQSTGGSPMPFGPSGKDIYQTVVSGDGQSVIYLSTVNTVAQLFFIRTNGSDFRQLINVPEGMTSATLSGDGKIVYAVTNIGALFRIETETGNIQQLIAPLPHIQNSSGPHAPGSLIILEGTRLAPLTAVVSAPFAGELAGYKMTVAGHPAPLLSISPERIIFQIPWDVTIDQVPPLSPYGPFVAPRTAIALQGDDTNFDAAFPFPVHATDGRIVALGPSESGFQPYAVHQDGSGLVTPSSPAKPGEIVTLYALGLGAVFPGVPNGVPTPFSPLSTASPTLQFDFEYGANLQNKHPATVPFVGLTPGFIGLYQINVLIPDDLPPQVVGFRSTFLMFGNFGAPLAIGAP